MSNSFAASTFDRKDPLTERRAKQKARQQRHYKVNPSHKKSKPILGFIVVGIAASLAALLYLNSK